jgi:hypothetical protein
MDQQVAWRPSFRGIQRLADGKTTLRFQLFAGATNVLETSTDLKNWTTLTNHPGAIGEFQFTDTETTARRFYRLRLP